MFNPWEASFEDAQAAQGAVVDSGGPTDPIFQWGAAQKIKARRGAIEAGDGFAVLWCVAECLHYGLVAPEWLTKEFLKRYRAVQRLHADSWDDPQAFGRPYKKHSRLYAMKRRRDRRLQAWLIASDLFKSGETGPIDESFFNWLGTQLKPPCGKTEASEVYYEALVVFGDFREKWKTSGNT